jgi:hypothetical protein
MSLEMQSFVTKLKSVDSTKGETELEMTVDISRLVRVISAEVLASESMMLLCQLLPTPSSDSR